MADQLFMKKLFEIKPFKQIQSPRDIKTIDLTTAQVRTQKHIETIDNQISKFTESLQYIETDLSQSQMINNITSNFDELFQKIERIKQEFQFDKIDKQQLPTIGSKENLKKIHSIKQQPVLPKSFPFRTNSMNGNIDKQPSNVTYYNEFQQLLLEKEKRILEAATTHQIIVKDQVSLKCIPTIIQTPTIADFQLGRNLGSGKFGDVFICKHKATNCVFALKKIFKSTLVQYNMVDQFIKQLKICYSLNHPNIIKLYTHFDDDYHIFLLMEYADGGMLMDHLNKGEEFVAKVLQQMLSAVQYLQKHQVAHRDIKPQNIVICCNDTMKLCDFGWASTFENHMKTTFCGTLDYVSPEMKDLGIYTMSVDLWSLGVLTFQLLCGFAPFKHQITAWRMKGGSRNTQWNWNIVYPTYVSRVAESFMRGILKQKPQDRFSVRMCKTHQFIRKYTQTSNGETLFEDEFKQILK